MRADVKVAMAIAVILIGIGVVWFAFSHDDASKDQKTDVDKTASPNGSDTNKVVEFPLTQKDTIPPLTSEKPLIASPYGNKDGDKDKGEDSTKTKTEFKDATADSSDDSAGKTVDDKWHVPYRPEKDTPSWVAATGTRKIRETTVTTIGLSTTVRTYVVKDNDSYWSIAKNLWGDGLLHPYLQKANPGILPEDLRPRMTIKVPPKPVRASSTSSTAVVAARHGTTGVDPQTGKRYYIVKESDRGGFWDISKAVYGEGKYSGLLEKANPKLDSRKLRAGMKVWCPDKPVKPVGAASVRKETTHKSSAKKTVPSSASTGGTGAPTKTTLPDGRIFD